MRLNNVLVLGTVALCALLMGCGSIVTATVAPSQLPAPVITPATGTYVGTQNVSMADAQAGAAVYYTTDGTAPTVTSTRYSAPFPVTVTTTLKAVAVLSGYQNSAVATSVVTINAPKAASPTFSPASGTYSSAQAVVLADSTPGATIYYTTDGTTPSASSTKYSTAIRVSSTTTLRAIAVATGYSVSDVATATFTITAGTSLAGTVTLGGKAVANATVMLYAAGSTGPGSQPAARGSASVLTDANGSFSLGYRCVAANEQVYLVSRSGTPAGRSGGPVDAIALVTALGSCGGLGTSYSVNEVTTTAAAYALSAFASTTSPAGTVAIGASSSNGVGLANAFMTAGVLANPVTGAFDGPARAATSTLPVAELKSLASMIASCGGTSGCAPLLSAATVPSGSAVVDSFAAMVMVAQNPGNHVGALFALTASGAGLTAAPVDWTLALKHTGGGILKPTAMGIDAAGNAWIASYAGAVAKLSPVGAPLSPLPGYTGGGLKELLGLTIDPAGNVWVTSSESASSVNSSYGAVQKFSSNGVLLSGASGYGGSAVYFPEAIAADANGNLWIANYGNSTVAVLNSSGAPLTTSGGLGSGTSKFSFPVAVATDGANGAWFTNQGGSTITHVTSDRTVGAPVTCCNAPSGVAMGVSGTVWVTNYYGNSLSAVSPGGSVVSAGYAGGGIAQPQGVAVDGAGNVWVANYRANTLSEFQGEAQSSPGSPHSGSAGFGSAAGLSLVNRIAIDSSGNLWATSNGNDSVVEFIGLATPVKTPLIGLPVKP